MEINFLSWFVRSSLKSACAKFCVYTGILQLDVGGGGGDIGKKNFHGGGDGGDDGGDDDDYFDDFDDGDEGEEGGLFRRRIVLQEVSFFIELLLSKNGIYVFM